MGAAKANNSKDTYLATAVTFMVIGALFLIDKLIHIIQILSACYHHITFPIVSYFSA